MKKSVIFFLSLLFLYTLNADTLVSTHHHAGSPEQLFSEGNQQYKDGLFFEAIESYESILESGVTNFKTYYNLGNAYFKTNQLPEAIYYYEKALQLSPGNEDALHNLKFSNSLIAKDLQTIPEPFHMRIADKVMKWFSPGGWAVAGIILFTFTLIIIGFFLIQVNFRLKRLLFFISVAGILLTSGTWFFGNRMYRSVTEPNHAIVMVSSAGVKSSPDKTSADVYVATAGVKVKIISTLGDWYEVRVPDGNKGWIPAEMIRLI
jgi:tetratricopeptide (TPR) repeat protein